MDTMCPTIAVFRHRLDEQKDFKPYGELFSKFEFGECSIFCELSVKTLVGYLYRFFLMAAFDLFWAFFSLHECSTRS